MHYITTWTKHMHINRNSSYNHSKEKLKQTKERTCLKRHGELIKRRKLTCINEFCKGMGKSL